MITPYKFYKIYRATHLHFTTTCDMFKYNAKARCITKSAFDARSDRPRFEYWSIKFQTDEEVLKFCVFNFLSDKTWFYNDFTDARDKYFAKIKWYSTLTKNVKKDHEYIKQIQEFKNIKFYNMVKPTESGNKPPLLQIYLQHLISPEYMCILDSNHNIIDTWFDSYTNDPLVFDELNKLKKYKPFVALFSNKV